MKPFILITSGLLLLLLSSSLMAAPQAILVWSPSPSEGVTGYKVYIGESSRYYSIIRDAGLMLDYFVRDLVVGKTYYFAVTAYDAEGNESDYSNEVSKLITETGDSFGLPPVNLRVQ